MIDFKFTKSEDANGLISQDLGVLNSDLEFVRDTDELQQNVRILLQFYKGEWFLDAEAGVPYFEKVFEKGVEKDVLDSIFKTAILGNKDILRITSFDSVIENRKYKCEFRADTVQGDVSFAIEEFIV